MFAKEDRQYLNNPAYSMALEKFFSKELETHYYSEQNDKNRLEKNVGMNLAIERVYPYSNEDLISTFEHLNLENKTIACTGSGGDEILMAIAKGATNIIHVDGNLFAEPYIKYKLAAIMGLSHEDFVKYFIDSNNFFEHEVFESAFRFLDSDAQAFWGTIYTEGVTPREIYNRLIQFTNSGYDQTKDIFRHKGFYEFLQNALREKAFNLRIETAELNEFPEAIKEKCDVILLSNIQQYVNDQDYIRTINTLYNDNLNVGGKIQLSYTFSKANWNRPAIDITPRFKDFFKDKQNQIKMLELDNLDKTYFLVKPAEKQEEKD